MEIALEIARAVLLIGGAICMILLFVLFILLVQLIAKINGLVGDIRYKYMLIQHYLLIPFKKLSSWLEDDD